MITYEFIGRWAFLTLIPALVVLRMLPRGSWARRILTRAIVTALLLVAASVALAYSRTTS